MGAPPLHASLGGPSREEGIPALAQMKKPAECETDPGGPEWSLRVAMKIDTGPQVDTGELERAVERVDIGENTMMVKMMVKTIIGSAPIGSGSGSAV